MEQFMKKVLSQFGIEGDIESIRPIKTGHINQTNVVSVKGHLYTVQTINTYVFPDADGVMENILSVTDHIRKKVVAAGGDPAREVLHFYSTAEGKGNWKDDEGRQWRVYDYIDDCITYDIADDLQILTDAGQAFGNFQKLLADYDGSTLNETIVNFHNTRQRYVNMEAGIERNASGRLQNALPEVAFYRARTATATRLVDQIEQGILPLRVTHNDTKFNNILIDTATKKPLCVIDLDTIMPGLAAYDFGDAIRFCANSAAEDEKDLSKVYFCKDKFEAFAKGFIGGADGFFTEAEVDSMVWGCIIMTLECGCRFLLDYLDGDKYFHTEYDDHNLVRARTQMKLVADMEACFDEMQAIVRKYAN
ncbi:MAG: aminoglycoside phosphotransferase family protein [Clostridia bacterium]|nr:aminoglycoside phosphotransferase family protein [Clostridia bacterium]